jgi:hypothetical protein
MKKIFFQALLIGASVSAATAGAQINAAPPVAISESGIASGSRHSTLLTDSARTYDSQALRFETSFGSADIIRGANGPVVGTVGWFRGFDVEKLVESSPQAVIEARDFKTANFRGSLVGGLGATTLIVGAIMTSNSSNNAASPILIIAGAGAVAWGAQHLNRGYAALSRSMWWYNRDLARSTSASSTAGNSSSQRDRSAPAVSRPQVTK